MLEAKVDGELIQAGPNSSDKSLLYDTSRISQIPLV